MKQPCPRCKFEKPLMFRVTSDLISEVVCATCALAALEAELDVTVIEDEGEK